MSILAQTTPVYQPAMRIISAITNAHSAQVTTTFAHNFSSLLIVRINIPSHFGMQEINQLIGTITVNSPTTFLIDIDTTTFSAFSAPTNYPFNYQSATVVPVGEDNSILFQATQNVLPYSAT